MARVTFAPYSVVNVTRACVDGPEARRRAPARIAHVAFGTSSRPGRTDLSALDE